MTHQPEAFYNLDDDTLRVDLSTWMEPEIYQRFIKMGFKRWPKQELLVTKWSTRTEDLVLEICGNFDIVVHESLFSDRIERFEQYAQNASGRAQRFQKASDQHSARFYMGQPILIGHHSERSARAAQRRAHNAMSKAVAESDRASYWKDRAAAAARRQSQKENPQVIYRRILRLEADHRKAKRERDGTRDRLERIYAFEDDGKPVDFEKKVLDFERYYQRIVDHLEMRLAFERARLESVGGLVIADIKKGDLVRTKLGWGEVAGVGPKKLSIKYPNMVFPYKIGREEVLEVCKPTDKSA